MKRNNLKKITKSFFKKSNITRIVVITIVVVGLVLLCSKLFRLNKSVGIVEDKNEALSIGENKYLEFLWMVDGAFNYERYDKEEFTVNNKILDKKLDFSCIYENGNKTCRATNFEKNFQKLFADNIKIDNVYGDGAAIKWYDKKNNEYTFTNLNNCKTVRMSTKQTLTVDSISEDKITYKVTFDEEVKSGPYKGNHHYNKNFVLIYQDNTWKVNEAYYHDPCYAEYLIK